jgi:hypothetical protein
MANKMIVDKYDVIVIGAGTGGWPAAVGAARCGARVLLIEEDNFAGGAPVDNYITMPCGGYITGVYAELLNNLERNHRLPVAEHGPIPKLWSRWFMPSAFAMEIRRIIAAEPNITFLSGIKVETPITRNTGNETRIIGVVLPSPDGDYPVYAGAVIDATGNGLFAVKAGAVAMYGTESKDIFNEPHSPEEKSDLVQQCTLMYISQRMGGGKFDFKANGLKSGVDPEFGWLDRDYEKGLNRNCGIYLTWGGTVRCADTRDTATLSTAYQEALALVEYDADILHKNNHTVHVAPKIGVREVNRIIGEEIITEQWLRAGKIPHDTVAIGSWFLDNWGGEISLEDREVPPYGIPLRALMPKGTLNLLMACRAISISHLAFSSWRVQPTVAAAGQAAGVSAALAAHRGVDVRDVPFVDIKNALSSAEHNFNILKEI